MSLRALLIFLLVSYGTAYSQIVEKWQDFVIEYAEQTDNSILPEALYDELSDLIDNPLDLNTATAEQLRQLTFLNDHQIDDLLAYRDKYGEMVSFYELKNIESLDYQTLSLLLPFIYIGEDTVNKLPFSVENLLKYGRNELLIRYDQGFQQKRGYREISMEELEQYPNRRYLGESFYHSLRYSYLFDDRLQVGLVAEKDAGEPFFKSKHKGYDYYSIHLFLKDVKWIKSFVVGDYKASFGQGLVMNQGFTLSRTALVAQAALRTNGFRRHYSTNEYDFLRGTATTINLKHIDVSLFYSYRKLDASVIDNVFTSIKTDGLHRVENDWLKRYKLPMHTMGGNIRYLKSGFNVGVTYLFYTFVNNKWQPEEKPYNLLYFRGSRNQNISLDYQWRSRVLKIFGETAFSSNGAIATLNALQFTPTSYFSFLALHRHYGKSYQAYFGSAFGQNYMVQNEQGIYLGLQFSPFPYWKISAYVDVYHFPWLRYGVDSPSEGKEYMMQVDYNHNEDLSAYIRYKYKLRAENKMTQESATANIEPDTQHRIRFQVQYRVHSDWSAKSSVDWVMDDDVEKMSKGYMIAQHLAWLPASDLIQANLYAAWFQTDDYDSRISSYEKNMLYAFNMPSFYGRGLRLVSVLRLKLIRSFTLSAKLAHTRYYDRTEIGTDLELIEGKRKTDIYTILSWKF